MEDKERPKKNKKRVLLTVLFSILALLLAVVAAVVIWGKSLLNMINRIEGSEPTLSAEEIESIRNETDAMDPDFSGPVLDEDEVEMPETPADAVQSENVINFLLVGQDRREGQRRQRSDAMILCTINKEKKTLTMTSFMRDLWVRIPNKYDERLNVPYVIGGFSLLNDTLEYQFGVRADHNIEVDFFGFEKVIDLVGGVDVELTGAEVKHLNSLGGYGLVKGVNHLNGKQALAYSRIRKIDNDFNRTNRQRTVIAALVEKMRTLSIPKLYTLVERILPLITTDMTDADILGYVVELAPLLSQLQIVSQRIPMDGAYSFARISGKSVLVMSPENLEKNKQLVQSAIAD